MSTSQPPRLYFLIVTLIAATPSDGYIRRLPAPPRRVFVFRIVVTNGSDAPNSLKAIRLLIEGTARHGMNLFTNSIIALHLETGKLAWYYQTIHHDLWDWDLVTGPVLLDVNVMNKAEFPNERIAAKRAEGMKVSVRLAVAPMMAPTSFQPPAAISSSRPSSMRGT